jgi:hypothetical protein
MNGEKPGSKFMDALLWPSVKAMLRAGMMSCNNAVILTGGDREYDGRLLRSMA